MTERYERFTTLVAAINRSVKKIKTEEMVCYNFKSIHVSCIYYLYRESGLTVSQLCEMCDEDKANISRALELLEERGYICPRNENHKRYKTPLLLTDEGVRVGELIEEKVNHVLETASRGMTAQERETMYKCLGLICDNLHQICDGYVGGEQGK